MKILIAISDSFCANFIKGQGQYMQEHGHKVVIVSGPGEEIDRLEREERVQVIRVPFAREISPIQDLLSLFKVLKIVIKEKPDIINAGNPKTGFLFSLAHLFFWKIPLIFTLRGVRSDTLTGIKKKIVKLTERITCIFSNKIIAISPSLKTHAINIGLVSDSKCIVLSKGSSNGINIKHYTATKSLIERSDKLAMEYNIDQSCFKVIFVGRVTHDKGLIELLEAFKICLHFGANICLIIAGPIEMQDPIPGEYYTLINEHPKIHYLGKQIDVRPVYLLANALVLYSHREGFGNVVIEAACMEVPSIVANIPGLKDTTENMKTGIHVDPKDPVKLSEAILKLYEDRDLTKSLGANAKLRVEKYFSNEVVWSKQLELYKNLCKLR